MEFPVKLNKGKNEVLAYSVSQVAEWEVRGYTRVMEGSPEKALEAELGVDMVKTGSNPTTFVESDE